MQELVRSATKRCPDPDLRPVGERHLLRCVLSSNHPCPQFSRQAVVHILELEPEDVLCCIDVLRNDACVGVPVEQAGIQRHHLNERGEAQLPRFEDQVERVHLIKEALLLSIGAERDDAALLVCDGVEVRQAPAPVGEVLEVRHLPRRGRSDTAVRNLDRVSTISGFLTVSDPRP